MADVLKITLQKTTVPEMSIYFTMRLLHVMYIINWWNLINKKRSNHNPAIKNEIPGLQTSTLKENTGENLCEIFFSSLL